MIGPLQTALRRQRGTDIPWNKPSEYDTLGLEQPAIDPILLISSLLAPQMMAMGKQTQRIIGNEVGALLPEDLSRLNSKTFYHGSSTPGLTKETIDPYTTSHENLFGQGLYTTDNPTIAESYAGKRGISKALYQARLNATKGIDLEAPLENDFKEAVFGQAKDIANRWGGGSEDIKRLQYGIDAGYIKTNQDLFRAFRNYVGDVSAEGEIPTSEFVEDFQNLNDRLRKMGYQVLKHTGGLRAGKGKTLHEVAVILDPSSIKDFSQIK